MEEYDPLKEEVVEKEVLGRKYKFFKLGVDELDLMMSLQTEDKVEQAAAMKKLFVKYMKYNFPEETEDKLRKGLDEVRRAVHAGNHGS